MPPRVYVDTSVVGGVHDRHFSADSKWVFDEAARGSLVLLVSDILVKELDDAPDEVRDVLDNLPRAAIEPVFLDMIARELRDAYLAAKVVGPKRTLDASHVAVATVARADACLSWDRAHIVGLARVHGYNKINRGRGYQELTIATPTRYRTAQAGTP